MKIALFDGASKRDLNLFEESFNSYINAIELISSTGNQEEVRERKKHEFLNTFNILNTYG